MNGAAARVNLANRLVSQPRRARGDSDLDQPHLDKNPPDQAQKPCKRRWQPHRLGPANLRQAISGLLGHPASARNWTAWRRLRNGYVAEVLRAAGDPLVLDYVRLNIVVPA